MRVFISLKSRIGILDYYNVLHAYRSLLRLFLLYKSKAGIQSNPPYQPLNREKIAKEDPTPEETNTSPQRGGKSQLETPLHHQPDAGGDKAEVTFVGRRSGRIIRTLKSGMVKY